MTSSRNGSVEVDWSGVTAVAACPLCGSQTGPYLSRVAANQDARSHWKTFHLTQLPPDIKPPCTAPDCDRQQSNKTLGLCTRHYQNARNAAKRARLGPVAKSHCTESACLSDHYAKGLCLKHYRAMKRRRAKAQEQ